MHVTYDKWVEKLKVGGIRSRKDPEGYTLPDPSGSVREPRVRRLWIAQEG